MTDKIAIYEGKNSEKVVKFIPATVEALEKEGATRQYANRILKSLDHQSVWGVYYTPSGRIKATFI